MCDQLKRVWKGAVMTESRYYPTIYLEGLRETSVMIPGVPEEIQTEHFPKTNLDLYHYVNPFGRT
jgi:hypothetical protein